MKLNLALLIPVLAMVVVAGCIGQQKAASETPAETPAGPLAETPAAIPSDSNLYSPPTGVTPYLTVEKPVEGGTEKGSIIGYRLLVGNFRLAAPAGANEQNEGHVDITVDGTPSTPHKRAITGARANEAAPYTVTGSVADVEPGQHTLKFELVNNDHTPLSTPVVQTVTFTAVK